MASAQDLYDKFTQLQPLYGTYHANVKKARRFYDLDFASDVLPQQALDRGFMPAIPRTARRTVDEQVDHILYVPKVRVPVRPTSNDMITAQEIAEKKRKAIAAWWRQVTQRFNPLGDGRKWLINDGMLAIKQTLRLDLLPDRDSPTYALDMDDLGKYEFMWNIEILNNEWVFPDPYDHRNPKYVYVAYEITVESAKNKYPGAKGEWTKWPDYSKVKYMEYWGAPTFHPDGSWDQGKFVQWIDSDVVKEGKNPYPYIPIAVDDSGWGLIHESAEPHEKFVGLNMHSFSVFIIQARQWTAMQAVAELTAFNPLITRNMTAAKAAQLKVGPGEIWNLAGAAGDPDAEDVAFAQWPPIPSTVGQMIALTDREVNGSLKTDMLGGIAQKGVDTASEADMNIRNASAKLSSPVAALERIAAKMTRWMLMDIEFVVEAPMTLFGSGPNDPADSVLSPDEIAGYYDCFVELRTTDEESLDMNRANLWGQLYQVLPFLSAFTAMEAGGISDDPLAEMIRRAGEDVFLSPQFTQMRVATGAQSFGELMQYIATLEPKKAIGGAGGSGTGMGGGDMSLVRGDSLTSPVESRIVSDSLVNRDVNQGIDEIRAGTGY